MCLHLVFQFVFCWRVTLQDTVCTLLLIVVATHVAYPTVLSYTWECVPQFLFHFPKCSCFPAWLELMIFFNFNFKSWWNRNSEILSQQPCCSNLLLRHSSPLLLLSLVKAHLLLTPLQASMLLSSIQASLLLRSLCSSLMPKLLCSSSCQEVKCWLDYILNILQTKKNKWHMCPDKIDHWWCLMYLWRSL